MTSIQRTLQRRRHLLRPSLRFTPYAWAKLLFLRDIGPTEVGGFGVANATDALLVEDVHLIHQRATAISVEFDDFAVADYFDQQVDLGRRPEQFGRIWIHTHPGDSALPSGTDEETFACCFGTTDWAVMFILAEGGRTYARLQFRAGPSGSLTIPVDWDWETPFAQSRQEEWASEYRRCVEPEKSWIRQDWLGGVDPFESNWREVEHA